MATFNGCEWAVATLGAGTVQIRATLGAMDLVPTGSAAAPTKVFRMIGRDANCVTQPTYRDWTSTGAPDPTAAEYSGSYCGGSKNIVDVWVEEITP
jgi:hypothetical protein